LGVKKILLDTNAYAAYLRGEAVVLGALGEADRVLVSVFVLGELLAGFKAGAREKHNREFLARFLKKSTVEVLRAGEETSEYFALVKHALGKGGTPIPINDVWIAAHALEAGATLVTYDSHFARVPGLRLWDEAPAPKV
jgi:tRNA(fMet)-specific endonuclease VapC